ncbi:MAG TPA: sigma-70 family RNA polymerase sigma factor [candidate division Zixibacteria bacterium]|nr:sigma-70 family RNA polymerase sigma factor [candidate division Zixibacteria bacterium]
MDNNEPNTQSPSPGTVNPNELDLVTGIAKGDLRAELAFVERFSPRLRLILQARTHDPDIAADLTQETLLEALCALRDGRLRDPQKLASFVLGIARNILNSHFRNQQRSPRMTELEEAPAIASLIEETLERKQYLRIAAKALATLDKTDNEILRLTLVEDLKPGAIAERLSLTSEVVRQRKSRATKRILEFIRQSSQKRDLDHSRTGRT